MLMPNRDFTGFETLTTNAMNVHNVVSDLQTWTVMLEEGLHDIIEKQNLILRLLTNLKKYVHQLIDSKMEQNNGVLQNMTKYKRSRKDKEVVATINETNMLISYDHDDFNKFGMWYQKTKKSNK